MNSSKNSDSSQNTKHSCSANEPTKIVFTIQNGNLLVTSKDKEVSKSAFSGFQSLSLKNSKTKEEGEGEIYIEIIRENVEKSADYSINNISTSYEAFWKEDFELCIDRRTCLECGHVLFTPQQLLHHMQNLHHIQNPEECFVCHKLFPNGSERTDHLRQTHCFKKLDVTCEACFKVFDSESDKNVHRSHHIERYNCKWCSEPFPCKYLLNNHLRNCSLRRIDLDCHICGCQFRSSHILQLHSLRHNRTSCELCHFSALNTPDAREEDAAVSLVRHMRNSHSPEEIDNILQKLKTQDKEEETLDKLFMSQIEENLNKLSESNPHSAEKTQNDQCWKISLKDQQDIVSESTEASLQCTECHKTFDSKEETVKHELAHQTPFACTVCSLKFSHRRGFKKHMRLHGILVKPSSVRYTCRHCSVNCATLSALHTHLLIHTDQKPHLCDKCGLKFRRSNALKAHDRTVHNSRVLHYCPQCDTASLSKSSLLRHIQCVHGGVRRFICGLCGNRCLQNQGLRRHLKSEHNLEFPPMESLCKKSSKEIHVIPPPENVSPSDPIMDILKLAIMEEKSKLEALRKQPTSEGPANKDNHKSLLCPESIIDGQSLNILGDVASKAAPLEQANILPQFLPKSQEATKFFCAGCQHCSDSLNNLLLHSTQCQQGSTVSIAEQESNEASVAKSPVIYSVPSSFARPTNEVSNGIPYQLCFVPPLNVRSTAEAILGAVPVFNNSLEHAGIPSINAGAPVPIPHTTRNLLAVGIPPTSLDDHTRKVNVDNSVEFSDNLVPGTELYRGSKLSVDIMSVNALESSQLEFLDSSNFIFQEDYLIREESCKIYDLNESSATFTASNTVAFNDSDLESLKRASEQSSGAAAPVSSKLVEVSAILPDNSKALDDFRSCCSVSNLVSEEGITTSNCGSGVPLEPGRDQSFNNSQNLKFLPIFNKSTTGPYNQIDKENNSSQMVNCSRKTLEKGVHVCRECGKQLSSASTYKRHLEVHFGGKLHKCSDCGKCFRYKHNLTVHMRSHTGERPFKCTVCERKFRYLSELNEHKLSHNGSKSFSCPECEQQFVRQRDLRRHLISHRKSEKPKCDICQKTFSRIDYLKRHIKSHKPSVIMDGEESSSCETAQTQVTKKYGTKTEIQTEFPCSPKNIKSKKSTGSKKCCTSYKLQTSADKDCTSDDLISLAYQAAEDGVEFMFVEEVTTCTYEQDIEVSSSEVGNNIKYIQSLDPITLK